MTNSLHMYWRLSFAARRQVLTDCEREEIYDEAEVLADYSDWPRLKAVIANNPALVKATPICLAPIA